MRKTGASLALNPPHKKIMMYNSANVEQSRKLSLLTVLCLLLAGASFRSHDEVAFPVSAITDSWF